MDAKRSGPPVGSAISEPGEGAKRTKISLEIPTEDFLAIGAVIVAVILILGVVVARSVDAAIGVPGVAALVGVAGIAEIIKAKRSKKHKQG